MESVNETTRLLRKRQELREVSAELELQKRETSRQERMFLRREQELCRKDVELQESMLQFDKFLRDKFEKKLKYDKMARGEYQHAQNTRKLSEKLRLDRQEMERMRKSMSHLHSKLKHYAHFLAVFHEKYSDDFASANAVLRRHAHLQKARDDLAKRQQDLYTEGERARTEQLASIERCRDEAGNEATRLRNSIEAVRGEVVAEARTRLRLLRSDDAVTQELNEIVSGITDLTQRAEAATAVRHHAADVVLPPDFSIHRRFGALADLERPGLEPSVEDKARAHVGARYEKVWRDADVIARLVSTLQDLCDEYSKR
ncbi:MAG: hypothetical protein MHM6MM_002304 [Cercozoa sp. M6MM]